MNLVPLPAFADNDLWMLQDGPRAIMVDPGDARPVFDALEHGGLQLGGILVKRPRADHTPHPFLRRREAHAFAAPRPWKNDFR